MSIPSHHELLMLPGMLNDADLWRAQIADLADIAHCHVGDLTAGHTMNEIAHNVLAKAPAKFALAGFSLGGYVALEILRIAAHRVLGLALLDTSIQPDATTRVHERQMLEKMVKIPGRFIGMGDRILVKYLGPAKIHDQDIIARIRAMCERLGPDVFQRQSALRRLDGRDILSRFDKPALILCGEDDLLTPPESHREMLELTRQGRLVIVPESGHMTPLEQPEAVSAALRVWLQAIEDHSQSG